MKHRYQNQSKTVPKPIENQLKNNIEMEYKDIFLRIRLKKE